MIVVKHYREKRPMSQEPFESPEYFFSRIVAEVKRIVSETTPAPKKLDLHLVDVDDDDTEFSAYEAYPDSDEDNSEILKWREDDEQILKWLRVDDESLSYEEALDEIAIAQVYADELRQEHEKIVEEAIQNASYLLRKDISQNAYFRWEYAGRPTGRDIEFWLSAEIEELGRFEGIQ